MNSAEHLSHLPKNYEEVRNFIAERRPVAKDKDVYFLLLSAVKSQASRGLRDEMPFHPVLKGWTKEDCRELLDDLGEDYKSIN